MNIEPLGFYLGPRFQTLSLEVKQSECSEHAEGAWVTKTKTIFTGWDRITELLEVDDF